MKCARCAEPMTKAEGGDVFTVCDACWTTDGLADVAVRVERDAALAALKVAREAMEAAQYQLPYPGDAYEILRRALIRISELVPS